MSLAKDSISSIGFDYFYFVCRTSIIVVISHFVNY
nr:MAG TPA: hypothetical protein [Caudoviricetes sp.]